MREKLMDYSIRGKLGNLPSSWMAPDLQISLFHVDDILEVLRNKTAKGNVAIKMAENAVTRLRTGPENTRFITPTPTP